MGYPSGIKGYLILDPKKETFLISRNVIFQEDKFPFKEIKNKIKNTINSVVTHTIFDSYKNLIKHISDHTKPSSYQQASRDPSCVKAMKMDMEALEQNDTWVLVNLPQGRKLVGSKWIYKIKYKQDGKIERFKARLVAQGYNQIKGFYYYDTYAPVAKMTTVKLIVSLASMKE